MNHENQYSLAFEYLGDDNYTYEGKQKINVDIKSDKKSIELDELKDKKVTIEIHYSNLYKKEMKAISPEIKIIKKQNGMFSLENSGKLCNIPFNNEIKN